MHELENQIQQAHNDIDIRSKELQRVRNEVQKEIKYEKKESLEINWFVIIIIFRHREEKLRNQNEEKIRDLVQKHDKEQKQLLEEFAKAHDSLKIRISELQIK